uniref:Reverse transcriptase domain-containing protein n=2 Tax=Kryptolebias marmoratus TaxID=37003 RepID=A0A3Q2ZLE5_KRYMA
METEGMLVWGGDFNVVLNTKLDTTNSKKQQNSTTKKFKLAVEEFGFVDIWRELHPNIKDYTHYSAPNKSYSRIDYFFINKSDIYKVKECEIEETSISDHSSLILKLNLLSRKCKTAWRLNVGLLNYKTIKAEISHDIKTYIEENDDGQVNPVMVWDALKAVIRGKLIAKTAALKKSRVEAYEKERVQLTELEKQHKLTQNPNLLIKIKEVRNNIDKILTYEIEKKSKFIRQSYHEVGSKGTKLLAKKLKKQQSDRNIHRMKDGETNQMIYDPEIIEDMFRTYYQRLYSQPSSAEDGQIKAFLESLDLPSIGETQNKLLTSHITRIEIQKAINRLKNGKTPGSDGLPSEWYKSFNEDLLPLLENSFNYTLEHALLPPSWREAIITVIPKKRRSETCSDYRPISILNMDYKIYTSVLAKRFEQFIGDIIDEDQTGFIRGRQTRDNIRRALHIVDHIQNKKIKAVLISLDAEKAFDSVGWNFLYKTLEKFGFNEKAVQCVRTLYQSPMARIKINGNLTDNIKLERSTRQGCCLSPTLFAIYIEPLAQYIRQHKDLKGIDIYNETHTIGLFADDVICYLSDPENSLPCLINQLETFGFYSGYKLNLKKTQVLTFGYTPSETIRQNYNLNWNSNMMTYLGIKLTKNMDDLYKANFIGVDQEIRRDIRRWDVLTLDFSSRIEAIKMNVLPRLLYLFLALPIEIPDRQFKTWNQISSRFIWNGKKPRIKFDILQLEKEKGGMALPDFREYYHAAQISPIMNISDKNYEAKWKNIEQRVQGRELRSIIGDIEATKSILRTVDTVTRFSLGKWLYIIRKCKLEKHLCLIQWPAYNKYFIQDLQFKQWLGRGLTALSVVLKDGHFKSFQELQQEFALRTQDHFRYLQLRDFYNKEIKHKIDPNENGIVKMLIEIYKGKKHRTVSLLYKYLLENRGTNTLEIKTKWERELGILLTEDDWLNIWKTQITTSSSRIWREYCWKNVIRFFITPKITSKFKSRVQPCWRDCGALNV